MNFEMFEKKHFLFVFFNTQISCVYVCIQNENISEHKIFKSRSSHFARFSASLIVFDLDQPSNRYLFKIVSYPGKHHRCISMAMFIHIAQSSAIRNAFIREILFSFYRAINIHSIFDPYRNDFM